MRADADLTPTALAYGRLAIAILAAVTITSAGALTIAVAMVLTATHPLAGPPYGDLPLALLAIGGAASLACLASAAAYAAQAARASALAGSLHATTNILMAAAYLAFAVGGVAFSHFCLSSAVVLSRLSAAAR